MIIVDLETTGLEPHKHAIVSIGAVDFAQPEQIFYRECRVHIGAEVDDGALLVNGFTRSAVLDPTKPTAAEVMPDFITFCQQSDDLVLAGMIHILTPGSFAPSATEPGFLGRSAAASSTFTASWPQNSFGAASPSPFGGAYHSFR